jgi:hypothetical protein
VHRPRPGHGTNVFGGNFPVVNSIAEKQGKTAVLPYSKHPTKEFIRIGITCFETDIKQAKGDISTDELLSELVAAEPPGSPVCSSFIN